MVELHFSDTLYNSNNGERTRYNNYCSLVTDQYIEFAATISSRHHTSTCCHLEMLALGANQQLKSAQLLAQSCQRVVQQFQIPCNGSEHFQQATWRHFSLANWLLMYILRWLRPKQIGRATGSLQPCQDWLIDCFTAHQHRQAISSKKRW